MRPFHGIGRVLGAAALLILSARPGAATGAPPKSPVVMTEFHGQAYETCRVDPATQDLRLYWGDAQGSALGNFTALEKKVDSEGGKLLFAANAGMFDPASKPVGLLVENGEEKSPLNLSDGYGNFFLKPNGVFLINAKHRALVIESSTYVALVTPAVWATQSGPLLVYGGDINPDFIAGSKNLKIRSGVGVTAKGEIVFALSKRPVSFYDFADLFLTKFGCPNALYLDGEISAFHTPGTPEAEGEHHFGPMFGLIKGPPHEGVTVPPATP
jgi:uncharacterized protein YigE (DUF2233 family)